MMRSGFPSRLKSPVTMGLEYAASRFGAKDFGDPRARVAIKARPSRASIAGRRFGSSHRRGLISSYLSDHRGTRAGPRRPIGDDAPDGSVRGVGGVGLLVGRQVRTDPTMRSHTGECKHG